VLSGAERDWRALASATGDGAGLWQGERSWRGVIQGDGIQNRIQGNRIQNRIQNGGRGRKIKGIWRDRWAGIQDGIQSDGIVVTTIGDDGA
jgi:hypothetical protein